VIKKIVLIGNPVAGGGALKKIRSAETTLRSRGFEVDVMLTSRRGDAESFARNAATLSNTIVIAAGGDGTYNEAANGLLHSETPLAILPLGTTSVLARELGIPLNTGKALDVALGGRTEKVSMGRITYQAASGRIDNSFEKESAITRHFLLMAGLGYDGDAVYGVNVKLKSLSGQAAYIFSGLGAMINYRPDELVIEAPVKDLDDITGGRFRIHPEHVSLTEGRLRANGFIAIISKAAAYGGNFSITPDADLKSPYLYVFLTHRKRKVDLMRLLWAIISGKSLGLRDISYFRTEDITIKGSCRIQIDGDYAGRAPAKIDVVQDALKLIVPA
jgi:diacylglycerol kinase family enzyme